MEAHSQNSMNIKIYVEIRGRIEGRNLERKCGLNMRKVNEAKTAWSPVLNANPKLV